MPTPEEIADRRFLVTLRGYDRDEVHAFLEEVAGQVAELAQRNAELEAQASAARLEGAVGPAASAGEPAESEDPDAAPGAAGWDGSEGVEEATERGEPGEQPAEDPPAERPFAGVGEEMQRVLEAAQEAAAAINRKARQDADRQVERARRTAARVVAEAERRRDRVDAAVTRLEERRDQVARQLAGAGGAIERVLSELVPADDLPAVREALADDAAMRPEAVGGEDPDEAETPAPADADAPDERGEAAADVADGPAAAVDDAEALVDEAVGSLADAGGEAEPAAARADGGPSGEDEPPAPADEPPLAANDPDAPVDEPAPVEELAPGEEEAVPADEARAPADDALVAAADEVTADEPAADELTADEPVVDGPVADGALAAEPAVGEPAAEEPADEASTALSDPSSPVTLRAGALEPVHPKLMRRVKRGMSDVQNLVLDRLRRHGGKRGPEALVPSEGEMTVLAEVGGPFLDQAYEAGVRAAAVLAGRQLGAPSHGRALDSDFAADGGQRIRESLLVSLRIGLDSGETGAALNDRVGAVFSELKSTVADELSAVHLIRAYEYGLLDAWAAGGLREREWLLGRELRCPEGRCRRNDETGAIDVTEAFPSGHEVPPVHVGCTCTTIPVRET